MSAASVIAAVDTVLTAVAQLKRVYDHAPASVQTADLPCAVITQGDTVTSQHAAGMTRYERTVIVTLAIVPTGQNRWPAKTAAALNVYDAVIAALVADWTLGGAADHIAEIRDTGYGVVTIAGVEHLGYEIRLTIIEKY